MTLLVHDIRFTAATAAGLVQSGLLGWIAITIAGAIRIDGVAVRRTRDGRLTLSFPVRHDARGRQHAIVRPIDDAARRAIEAQVFAAMNLQQETAP